jgi:NAD(P)-dependent dehydrogenase (short-subunit alcohol dehydrogenase family)
LTSALVTGAARRIGKAIALDLAAAGHDIAIHYNSSADEAEAVADAVRSAGRRAVTLKADLAGADSARIVGEASAALGGLGILINNASLFEPDEIDSIIPDSWTRHLDINLRAPVFLAQAFAAQLPEGAQGNIINIIDQRVLRLNPKFFSYTIAKSALWTATRTLAQALAPRIRVNAIGPGPTLPSSRMDEAEFQKQADLTLLERRVFPEEICATVRYILSQPSLTGQMLALDSGAHLFWKTDDVMGVKE